MVELLVPVDGSKPAERAEKRSDMLLQHEVAEEAMQCAAMAMGTRGPGAVAGLVLGSVAARIVQLAPVPVTLVK